MLTFLAKNRSGMLDIVKNMEHFQNQRKQFYEDQLSSRKGWISEEVDEEYERKREEN